MSAPTPIPGLSVLDEWIDADQERALLAAVDASPWRDDLARRVQHYGFRYDYRGLLVLTGEARSRWGHAIAGRKSDLLGGARVPRGRRVSLTFRTVRVGG